MSPSDLPGRRVRPARLVRSAGPRQERAELVDGVFEVGAGEALAGDHEPARWRLPLEYGLTLGSP